MLILLLSEYNHFSIVKEQKLGKCKSDVLNVSLVSNLFIEAVFLVSKEISIMNAYIIDNLSMEGFLEVSKGLRKLYIRLTYQNKILTLQKAHFQWQLMI